MATKKGACCPYKANELTVHSCKDKICLTCSHSFSEEHPNGDVLHCMCKAGKVVPDNGFCKDWN